MEWPAGHRAGACSPTDCSRGIRARATNASARKDCSSWRVRSPRCPVRRSSTRSSMKPRNAPRAHGGLTDDIAVVRVERINGDERAAVGGSRCRAGRTWCCPRWVWWCWPARWPAALLMNRTDQRVARADRRHPAGTRGGLRSCRRRFATRRPPYADMSSPPTGSSSTRTTPAKHAEKQAAEDVRRASRRAGRAHGRPGCHRAGRGELADDLRRAV